MGAGFFTIGIENSKTPMNIGTLWRSAYVFGAAGIFTINRRYERQASDNIGAINHIPLQHFQTFPEFFEALPFGAKLVGIELDDRATPLRKYVHADRAVYLLGAEDHGLTERAREACHDLIVLPGKMSLNVAVAGSVVMAHRIMQREREAALMRLAVDKVQQQMPKAYKEAYDN